MMGAIVIVPTVFIMLAALLSERMFPDNDPVKRYRDDLAKARRQLQAHFEALTYLGSVIDNGADRAPDPEWVRQVVAKILELKEYPKNVGKWEEDLAAILFTDEEPVDAWTELLGEYFEFARTDLYFAFVKKDHVEAYELVRKLLQVQGIEAKTCRRIGVGAALILRAGGYKRTGVKVKQQRSGQQRRKGQWHPLLVKLMNFAVAHPKLARNLVAEHPEALNLRTGLGETALHYLSVENYADAVQLLIDLGADVNVRNNFGKSPLQEAIQVGATQTVEVLRRAGGVE